MSVFDILDEMDDMLDNAKAFPLAAHKIVIDGDRLREADSQRPCAPIAT